MIKAVSIKKDHEPYLTRLEDENGRNITVNSSSRESEYLSPSQLIQAGLAGCTAMTVKGALFKAGIPYDDVSVTVQMKVTETGTEFSVDVDVQSSADPEAVKRVRDEAIEKCYVHNILASEKTFINLSR